MKKTDESKTQSHQNVICLTTYDRKSRPRYSKNKFKKAINNNVYPLKPEFRQHTKKNIGKDKSDSTLISALLSSVVICLWCLAMLLLAKASYQFLREICLKSVQTIELNQK